jgi:hypothetical protein
MPARWENVEGMAERVSEPLENPESAEVFAVSSLAEAGDNPDVGESWFVRAACLARCFLAYISRR